MVPCVGIIIDERRSKVSQRHLEKSRIKKSRSASGVKKSPHPNNKIQKQEKPDRERIYGFDNTLLTTLIFLLAFGLVMLYSVSYNTGMNKHGDHMYFLNKQFQFVVIGFICMPIIVKIPHTAYGAWRAWVIYGGAFILMIMVKTSPLGVMVNGAYRWLELPFFGTFQPSEFMKVGVITLTPTLIYKYKIIQMDRDGWIPIMGPGLVAAFYAYVGTDNLSTALIIAGITVGIAMLLSPDFYKFIKWGMGIGALVIGTIFLAGDFLRTYVEGFRWGRILEWTDLESYATDGGYQVLQGLYAIGAGGLFGKGLGNGTQKLSSIPEVQNDMIFAAISEELGIFGLVILLFLYGVLLYRLFVIAQNAPTLHSSLIVSGIFLHIALQVVVNLCVVTALLPNTGVTLPFISYGGTALLVLICEISIALGISRQ